MNSNNDGSIVTHNKCIICNRDLCAWKGRIKGIVNCQKIGLKNLGIRDFVLVI